MGLDNAACLELALSLLGEHTGFLGGCYKVWGCWDGLSKAG